jgi:hypothetical protein
VSLVTLLGVVLLGVVPPPVGRTFRVHVYADVDYRNSTPSWRHHLQLCFDLANQKVASLGARFAVGGMFEWERSRGDGALASALRQLEAVNDGAAADWVLGFVGGIPVIQRQADAVGTARELGRHSVQRAPLWRTGAPRRHVEVSIMLHEWGHLMGAIHTRGASVMSTQMGELPDTTFDAPNRLLLLLGVRNKPGPAHPIEPGVHVRILRETIHRLASPIWDTAARRSMNRHLAALAK